MPKHFYKKNKQKKLTIKEIFENKLECCWKYDDLRKKNVYLRDNTSNEILKVIKFSFNKKKRFISFKNEKFYKRQKFKIFNNKQNTLLVLIYLFFKIESFKFTS